MIAKSKTSSQHWLRPLLAPESIAYVGASARAGSAGNGVLKMVALGEYQGRVYPVNPGYEKIENLACFPSLRDLPEVPELVVLALADQRLEQALVDAIEVGVKSAVIFGGANLVEVTEPKLPARLRDIGKEANLPICGGNGMGFYNLTKNLLLTFSVPPYKTREGGATLLSHSGSSWSAMSLNDGRLGFNLSVSSGQELTVSVADYLDYAVEQNTTTVVGLILETIRDPQGFRLALRKANEKNIPVVALKVGRNEKSAQLAISHSGAIAGDDGAYEAVFERYGVSRVQTLEELAATLALLDHPKSVGPGDLASIHDSGFERELFVDLADDKGVSFAEISATTTERLSNLLDPGLEPVNPVDAWGTGHDYQRIFIECFDALVADAATALGFVSHNPRDDVGVTDAWLDVLECANERHDKPVALVGGFPWMRRPKAIERLTALGIPLIEGMDNALVAAKNAFEQRDFRSRPSIQEPHEVAAPIIARWRQRLAESGPLDEVESLSLLSDFGIPTACAFHAGTLAQVIDATNKLGSTVVLKTASPGIYHKSDVDGVRLNLTSLVEVESAYRDISSRLGPQVLVTAMIPAGVEMSLGLVKDPQFGPLVMIGAGGVLIELSRDRRLALPPFDADYAFAMIDKLKTRTLLDGYRGREAGDVAGFANAASRLSLIAIELGDLIAELDVNPLIVGPCGVTAVDALIVSVR